MGYGDGQALDLELTAVAESVPIARERVEAWLGQLEPTAEQLFAIKLVVTEAVNNVVLHAYRDRAPGPVRVRARARDSELTIAVDDAGAGMGPRHDSPGLGMGLPLIARLADGMSITCVPPREAGTELHVTFRLAGDSASRHLEGDGALP